MTFEVPDHNGNAAVGVSSDEAVLGAAWPTVKEELRQSLNEQVFEAYLSSLSLIEVDTAAGIVTLTSPSKFIANYVHTNFGVRIQEAFHRVCGVEVRVRCVFNTAVGEGDSPDSGDRRRPATQFVVKRDHISAPPAPASDNASNADQVLPALNPRYTFSSFVVGSSNQFCHAAAMRVAENPGQSYNPLFIYGGVGLGKTHLLHAIGNQVLSQNPHARILYLSSETFTNDLIMSLRNAKMDEFKRRMRAIELLLIDDIQFISGKERTQEEFFHTFNALYSAKRQIVITSDKIPTDIVGIEERLQTRFSWGLTADLQAPDFETRVAIIKQKAAAEHFELPEDVASLIAEKVSSNVRELEGALTRLHAVSSIQNIPISVDMARSALKHLLQPKVVALTVDDIKKAVATHFGIKVSEIISKRRTKNLSFPRHIAMYLCRKHTTYSYPEIGEHFGGRDHSSVIHAATVVSSKVSSDQTVKELVETIEKMLLN
jgi:chromosomal replication initiator protein